MTTGSTTVDIRLAPAVPRDAVVARGVTVEELPTDTVEGRRLHLAGFDARPGQVHVVAGATGPEFLLGL